MAEIKKIIDGFKHAFATTAAKLDDGDIALLKKLAVFVVRRKMSVPATMFLESARPLNFIGSQAMVYFKPILTRFFSIREYNKIAGILENREAVDVLIDEIEKLAGKKDVKAKP